MARRLFVHALETRVLSRPPNGRSDHEPSFCLASTISAIPGKEVSENYYQNFPRKLKTAPSREPPYELSKSVLLLDDSVMFRIGRFRAISSRERNIDLGASLVW